MNWKELIDRTTILVAFLATLGVFLALSLHGTADVSVLRDLLMALGGALAGIAVSRGGDGGAPPG